MQRFSYGQNHFFEQDSQLNQKKLNIYLLAAGTAYVSGYTYLAINWYKGTDRTGFHWFNDLGEWKQMDKIGHALGSYVESEILMQLFRNAGMSRNKQIIWGGVGGFLMQAPVEVLDGFSADWGASAYDLLGDALGSGLSVANHLLWDEARIQMRFSFHPTSYASQRPDLLGRGLSQVFKDYNGQTYWLTCRVHSFLPESKFKEIYPHWLSLAVGYGAEGMIGGYGKDPQSVIDSREYRQCYLSLFLDLSQIRTHSKFLKTAFKAASIVRIPMPAVGYDRNGFRFYPIYF